MDESGLRAISVWVSGPTVNGSGISVAPSISASTSRMEEEGTGVRDTSRSPLCLKEGCIWSANVVGALKRNLDLPSSQKSFRWDGVFETYSPSPPRPCIGLAALDPAEPLAPGLQLSKVSFTRPKIPLVVVFRDLPVVALRAVPLFSFRFLSARSLISSDGGGESLGKAKLFN